MEEDGVKLFEAETGVLMSVDDNMKKGASVWSGSETPSNLEEVCITERSSN
jgi:hypothetical protein